jgi:hypothetical protein
MVPVLIVLLSDIKTVLRYRRDGEIRTVYVYNQVDGIDRESSEFVYQLPQIVPVSASGM